MKPLDPSASGMSRTGDSREQMRPHARFLVSAALLALGLAYPLGAELLFGSRLAPYDAPISPRPCEQTRVIRRNVAVAITASTGIVTGGTTSVLTLLSGGFSLGIPIARSYRVGLSPRRMLAATLPHLVIEAIGICLAGAAGLLGFHWLLAITRGRSLNARKLFLQWAVLLCGAVTFVLIGASLECRITPRFIEWVG